MKHTEKFKPKIIIHFLMECYHPATAFKMAVTIQSMTEYQHWKQDKEWNHLLKKELELRKNEEPKKQAIPISPEAMGKIYAANPCAANTIIAAFLWVSGSRYGDLKWLSIIHKEPIEGEPPLWLALINYRGTKGDPTGRRGDQKALFIPRTWLAPLELQFQRQREKEIEKARQTEAKELGVSYKVQKTALDGLESPYMVKKAMSVANTGFTLHSARRGACHTLLGIFPLIQIAELALHSQKEHSQIVGTCSYTFGAWFLEKRERNQMAMSLALLSKGKFISHSTMRTHYQARCKEDVSKSQAFFN